MIFYGMLAHYLLVFILEQVMPAVVNVMKEEASLVTLVKPQFEAGRSQVRDFLSFAPFQYTELVGCILHENAKRQYSSNCKIVLYFL